MSGDEEIPLGLNPEAQIVIPTVDEFASLKSVVQEVRAIIEKIDFIDTNKKLILVELCNDAQHFLEIKKPRQFVMYVSHAIRELSEKLFGEAKSVGKDALFNFSEGIPVEILEGLNEQALFGFIESRDKYQIKLKRFIEIEERDRLLRMSTNEAWHQSVWELNDTYAGSDSAKRDLGTKQFFRTIPAKYSVSNWTYDELIKTRKALYKKLSGYAHGGKLKEIIEVLNKSADQRSTTDNEVIRKYVEANMSIIDIFRPFESTTSEKIKKIDELLNG